MQILRYIFFIVCINIMLSLFYGTAVVGSGYNNDEFGDSAYNLTGSGNYTTHFHTNSELWSTGVSLASICDSTTGTCTINLLDWNLWSTLAGTVIGLFVLIIKSIVFMPAILQDVGLDYDIALMLSAPYYLLLVLAIIQIVLGRTFSDMW